MIGNRYQARPAAKRKLIGSAPLSRASVAHFVYRLAGTNLLAVLCAGLLSVAAERPRKPAAGPIHSSAQVLGVRFSSQPNYSRVVVDLGADVHYTVGRLSDPERLYLDLLDTQISPKLGHRQIRVGDTLVDQIRIGSNQGSVTRVVLDLKSDARPTISVLSKPPRLLVELRGQSIADEPTKASSTRNPVPAGTWGRFPKRAPGKRKESPDGSPESGGESASSPGVSIKRAPIGAGPTPYGSGENPGLNYAGTSSPQNVLLIDLSAESNYDDNIRGNNQQHTGDVGFLLGPGISFRRQGKQLTLALSYQPHFRIYRRASDRNIFDQGLQLDADFRPTPHFSVRARGSVLYTMGIFRPNSSEELVPGLGSPSSLNQTVFTPLERRLEHNVRFDATYQFSRRSSLGFFAGLSARDFLPGTSEAGNLGDTQKRNAGVLYRYRLSQHNTLGVNYILQDLRFGPNARTLVHSTIVSFARQLSPTVTLDLFGGPEYTRLHDRLDLPLGFFTLQIPIFRTGWNWAVGGDLTKRSEHTVFQITAQRQVSDGGGLFGSAVTSYVGGSVRRRLPRRWDALWTAGYARTSALSAVLSNNSLESQTAGFGLEHALTEHFSLRLGYSFLRQRNNGANPLLADFDRNLWYVSVFYRFSPITLGR